MTGHTVADHFVDITEMVGIGSGGQRAIEDWALSRYACYLIIQTWTTATGGYMAG